MRRIAITSTLALMTALTTSAMAQDKPLKLSSGFPPVAVPPIAYKTVAEWLAASSAFKAEVFSMTLLSLQETSAGIRDGITDVGYVLTPYSPAEFSEMNLAADMSMLVTTGTQAPNMAMSGAIVEYVTLNCPDCQDEFTAQNQVFLGGGASTAYSLVCKDPINTIAEIRGKSIRVGAPVFGRWVEKFGGTKASIPGSEMFEALSQGVVQCTMVGTPDVVNFQLQDVVKSIMVGAPGGVFGGTASMNVNLDLWRSLTDEERRTLIQAGSLMTAEVNAGYNRQAVDAEKSIRDKGIAMVNATDEFVAATNDFVREDMKTIRQQFTSLYGVNDVAKKMATITTLVDKWKVKLEGVDPTDGEAYRKLLWKEIYSKLDPATYGMK
ncbi:TRAP transporter substrate-binding protein DctP [Mesorhizobium australicum]|uniref:TRAP-type C4-dicarboxylate transport system, substrate-binding protein n=1 Tax=Mesorhizobium australicum TaxID=536018 RepID=A0A1X7N0W9_9HYPH|nr:TRAP transporter substrate-binding protein DctP [Mesorhizobium australicum]SMH30884.1 TRAP-type C4-dicarboxylate transport system, substrate-binding protein [Mesorhizobium australicum]